MWCRCTNRVVFVSVIVCGLVAFMAVAVGAQEAPIEVHSVDLRTNETLGTVVLGAEEQVGWSTEAENRTLIIFLPHTVPGPDALDRSSRVGLISLVEVGFAVPGGVPTTRVTVHARGPFTHEVEGSGAGLTIRLTTAAPAPAAATAAAGEPESPVDSEELEKAREESERLRKRVAELHSDRLELRESLERAQRELAEQPSASDAAAGAAELELEKARLVEEVRSQRAQLAESQEASTRASAQIRELTQRLEASESKAIAAAEAGESADTLSEDLARSAAREKQLSQQLRERRSVATSLRAWLSKAPEILGASTFVVSSGDSCLPLRPEPTSASAVLQCLPSGSRLEALSFRPDWLRVRAEEGKEGWVSVTGVSPPESVADTSVRNSLDESRSEVARLRNRVTGLEGELTAAQSRVAAQASQATGRAELGRAAARLAEVEAGSAENSRELDLARQNLGKAQEESESQKRRLRALLAEVALGQPTISKDADPCLTVRAGPGTEHRRMDCVGPGTVVSVEDAATDWLSITTASGLSGWVASRFVLSNSAVDSSESADSEALAASVAELDRLRVEVEAAEARNRASVDRFEQADATRKELDQALANLKDQQEIEKTEALSALKVSQVVVKDDVDSCLSLRVEPRVASRSLDCLVPGTEAATVAVSGGWFRLRLQDDREGWSSAEFLESVDQRELRRLAARARELDETLNRERDAQRQVQQELVERDELIADLRSQLVAGSGTAAELERLSLALDESREELSRMTGDLAQAENRRIADLNTAQQDRAGLEGQIEAARNEINRLGPLAGRAGEVPILESALENARGELESSQARSQALEARVAQSAEERSRPSEADLLEQKVAALEADLVQTRELLSASEANNERLAVKAASAESVQRAAASAANQRAALQRQVTSLQADLSAARESLAKVESRNQALEADAKRLVQLAVVPVPPAPAAVEAAEPSGAQIAREAPAVETVRELTTALVEEDLELPSPVDLQAFARAWARAWSGQRVDDYLSYYASGFVPSGGMSRAQWADLRRNRLTRPDFIEVTLSNYSTRIDGPDRAMVTFDQEYRSDTFQDRVVKTLELVRDGDLWRIQEEITN